MLGLDTNVLLRYLIRDDAKQARIADNRIERGLAEGDMFFVNHIVLCELAWTLDRSYRFAREDIAGTLEYILATAQFVIDFKDDVTVAINDYKTTNADFADCLIGRRNKSAGCERTISFDRDTKSLGAFEII